MGLVVKGTDNSPELKEQQEATTITQDMDTPNQSTGQIFSRHDWQPLTATRGQNMVHLPQNTAEKKMSNIPSSMTPPYTGTRPRG